MLVLIVLGRFGLNIWSQIQPLLNPPKPPEPTLGFGLLPVNEFPAKNTRPLTLRLETVGDQILSVGPIAQVYQLLPTRSAGFFDVERAKKQAAALSFTFEPQQIGSTNYRWTRSNPVLATLTMDTINKTLSMRMSWETDPGFLLNKKVLDLNEAVVEAKRYLSSADYLPEDMTNGRTSAKYLRFSGGTLVPAVSLSEADFVQVDLFRATLSVPIYAGDQVAEWVAAIVVSDDPLKGKARLVLSGKSGRDRVVSAEMTHQQVDYQYFQTYPVISGYDAWKLLQSGYGFIAKEPETGDEAVVRRVGMGYYDPPSGKGYLQPIYIFYGDNGFVAYVPAVHPNFFQSTTDQQDQ